MSLVKNNHFLTDEISRHLFILKALMNRNENWYAQGGFHPASNNGAVSNLSSGKKKIIIIFCILGQNELSQ